MVRADARLRLVLLGRRGERSSAEVEEERNESVSSGGGDAGNKGDEAEEGSEGESNRDAGTPMDEVGAEGDSGLGDNGCRAAGCIAVSARWKQQVSSELC